MSIEVDITVEQAREIIAEHGGYGASRVYAVYGESSIYAAQITGIKSERHIGQLLEQGYSRLYCVTNDGTGVPPIRKAN